MNRYSDIINLPHHVSKTRKPMDIYNRAAQFAPFAALTGFDDSIKETGRLTSEKIELSDYEKEIINDKLIKIKENIKSLPNVSITYFVKDIKKQGGKYVDIVGNVRVIDLINNTITFTNKIKIIISDIIDINIL